MANDVKFDLWIEIQKSIFSDDWYISMCIHECFIYDKKFFITGYPIATLSDKDRKIQTFVFNPELKQIVRRLLLPKSTPTIGIKVTKEKAYDYHHFLHYSDFQFNVHPVSMSGEFLRHSFTGTQEEIYNKALELNSKYISKYPYFCHQEEKDGQENEVIPPTPLV